MTRRPLVAIVGRPNVGKSTLFNRLARRRRAIVENTPGVTRDRHFADVELDGRAVTLVDTGGFVPDTKEDPLAHLVRQQAQAAVEACEVVVFVCDGKAGVTAGDEEVARYLRKQTRPLVLVVNKCDSHRDADAVAAEFHRLGLGEPVPVSAEHGENISALVDRVTGALASHGPGEEQADATEAGAEAPREAPDRPLRVAIVGRPNVGKSTLVNALLGEERVIVSPLAGTTRDPIDTELTWKGKRITLTDTAGIRKKSAVIHQVEHFAVLGAVRAIEDSDVAVLVLDATEAAVDQDLKIAAMAEEKGRALIVCVNKWDLVRGKKREEEFRAELKWYLKWVAWAPMIFVTAKTGERVGRILDVALELAEQQYFRAPTPRLNKLLEHVTSEHPLPVVKGRQLRLYYVAQVGSAPPAFAFICNTPDGAPDRYARYVANHLREVFGLKVPIRLFWRERPGQKQRDERAKRFVAREESKRQKLKKRQRRRRQTLD
ncbi:MAG: ribosome biogenesis GTPase Der [Myxococcota bacterium]